MAGPAGHAGKVYVSGLPEGTTAEDLAGVFSQVSSMRPLRRDGQRTD